MQTGREKLKDDLIKRFNIKKSPEIELECD